MKFLASVAILFVYMQATAQPSFIDYQRNFPRVADAMNRKADTLKKQFAAAGLQWPAKQIYVRSFNYHMSLGINYPNVSDKIVTQGTNPGGDIYIHGSCVTVGCIPIQDPQIEELYILAMSAKSNGQDFIPVHIFPVRYNNPKSMAYFDKTTKDDSAVQQFAAKLKEVYDYFEREK